MVRNGTLRGLSVEFRSLHEHRAAGVRRITAARLGGAGLVDSGSYGNRVEVRHSGVLVPGPGARMAVTATVAEVAAAIRLGSTAEETAQATPAARNGDAAYPGPPSGRLRRCARDAVQRGGDPDLWLPLRLAARRPRDGARERGQVLRCVADARPVPADRRRQHGRGRSGGIVDPGDRRRRGACSGADRRGAGHARRRSRTCTTRLRTCRPHTPSRRRRPVCVAVSRR